MRRVFPHILNGAVNRAHANCWTTQNIAAKTENPSIFSKQIRALCLVYLPFLMCCNRWFCFDSYAIVCTFAGTIDIRIYIRLKRFALASSIAHDNCADRTYEKHNVKCMDIDQIWWKLAAYSIHGGEKWMRSIVDWSWLLSSLWHNFRMPNQNTHAIKFIFWEMGSTWSAFVVCCMRKLLILLSTFCAHICLCLAWIDSNHLTDRFRIFFYFSLLEDL